MTKPENKMDWTTLHDLGLIYLTLTHGADSELAPSEMEAMSVKLGEWQPDAPRSHIRRVMNDVLLAYMSPHQEDLLDTAIVSVYDTMERNWLVRVLNDLADIASADGIIVGGEISFIEDLARRWNVDGELG